MARSETSSYGVYTRMAIALHWAVAVAILGLLAAGWWMTYALEAGGEPTRRLAYEVIQLHKALGLTVLALSLFRLVWRLLHPAPPLPADMPAWQKRLSEFSHFCLYGFMIGAPLTGWAMVSASPEFSSLPTSVFGLFIAPHFPAAELSAALFGLAAKATADLAREAHHLLALLGALLLAAHVGAALKHHFVDQDQILARMTPGVAPRRPVFEPPAPRASGLARGLAAGVALAAVSAGSALFLLSAPGPTSGVAPQSAAAASSAIRKKSASVVSTVPSWIVDADQSVIGFSGAHLGSTFQGVFERWRAEIRFDPEDLASGSARVEIETASAKTGNAQYDGALPQADWFDAAAHPVAVFEAARFEAAEPEAREVGAGEAARYRAIGTLTIKGTTAPAILPFSLTINDGKAEMQGELTLDRLAYGLGRAADPGAAYVAKEVTVSVKTVAARAADQASAR